MSTDAIALGTAAMLGFLHALEVDHMVAVTTFVSRRPTPAAAVRFGLKWGIGHSVAVLAAGGLLLATGLRWPARYDALGEALVGLMLIGLGSWALVSARKLHLHSAVEHGGSAQLQVQWRHRSTRSLDYCAPSAQSIARRAISSFSADSLPKTRSTAVRNPHGIVNAIENGRM